MIGGQGRPVVHLMAVPKVPREMLAGDCLPDCFDMRYDFAVLTTDPSVDGGWIPLSIVTKVSAVGDMAITIAGYGDTNPGAGGAPGGLYVGKQLLHLAATADEFAWSYKFQRDDGSSICNGDSGGPVFQGSPRSDGDRLPLIGVISNLAERDCLATNAVAVNLTTPGPAKTFCALVPAGTAFCTGI